VSPRVQCVFLGLLLVFVIPVICVAEDPVRDDAISVTTEYTYIPGGTDSSEKARALALFGARLKAIQLAAKYLTHKGLLEHFEKRQNEIFCLAADEIETTILEDKFEKEKNTIFVKISADITSLDFIRARIKNLESEKQEAHFSYTEEMEQPVLSVIAPGMELSRAYRYMRRNQWRIAIIYLDHLEKKYSHWSDLYLAKAIANYGMNDTERMLAALKRACTLNSQEACHELESIVLQAP